MFFVWVTSAGISLNSDKQNSSSTTSAKTSSTFPRVAMAHQTLISWVFSRARDSQAPCPMLIYSWLLIPKGCEVLTEGPAQMLKFMSIFLEKIRLEKVQGSNRECKISSVPSSTEKTIKLPGESCLHGSGTPGLLPSVTSAIQVCMLAQEILPVSFCSGQIMFESFIHHIILYQKQQEKEILSNTIQTSSALTCLQPESLFGSPVSEKEK